MSHAGHANTNGTEPRTIRYRECWAASARSSVARTSRVVPSSWPDTVAVQASPSSVRSLRSALRAWATIAMLTMASTRSRKYRAE